MTVSAQTLASVLSVQHTDLENQANTVEGLFKVFFQTLAPGENALNPLTQLITLVEQLESSYPIPHLESTKKTYSDGHALLTKALVYLIDTHGFDKDLCLTPHALAILRDARILSLIHLNNHQLIYEINRAKKKREEALKQQQEIEQTRRFLEDKLKKDARFEARVLAFYRFMSYLKNPLEEKEMLAAFKVLCKDFKHEPDIIALLLSMASEEANWDLLNTVYQYYLESNPLGVEEYLRRLSALSVKYPTYASDIQLLQDDLRLVDQIHMITAEKTDNQVRWMAMGGFAFGMEIAMLALENIALTSSFNPWAILAISLGACLVFGPMISMYFNTGHYHELKKMNQREYFESVRPRQYEEKSSWGRIVGHIGTTEEAIAAGTLLFTLGALVGLDTVSRGIVGGDYNSALPGYFFYKEVLMQCHWGWYFLAGAAVFSLMYASYQTACAMKFAHFALDVPNCIEYFNELEEDTQMRGVINADTQEPLFFSNTLKWRHNIGVAYEEFKDEYFPSQNRLSADI